MCVPCPQAAASPQSCRGGAETVLGGSGSSPRCPPALATPGLTISSHNRLPRRAVAVLMAQSVGNAFTLPGKKRQLTGLPLQGPSSEPGATQELGLPGATHPLRLPQTLHNRHTHLPRGPRYRNPCFRTGVEPTHCWPLSCQLSAPHQTSAQVSCRWLGVTIRLVMMKNTFSP